MTPHPPFDDVLQAYRSAAKRRDTTGATPRGSEASWDYCYSWFNKDRRPSSDDRRDCLELGYYLANWGMFRGSGSFMTTNLAALLPALPVINAHHDAMQRVDLTGTEQEWSKLKSTYDALESALPGNPSTTLVTKVMLGVWGCMPAMDTYVLAGIRQLLDLAGQRGLTTFNRRFYNYLSEFRHAHAGEVDRYREAPLATFGTSAVQRTQIPAGKVLDMYFFQLGQDRPS